MRHVSGPLAN